MPIHFKSTGGAFVGGSFTGAGEIYTSDDTGAGQIRKGTFRRGKLGGPNCTLINYTNTSFTRYTGAFVDDKMHGTIEVLSYEQPSDDPDSKGKTECKGNGACRTLNTHFARASAAKSRLTGTKKEVVYNAGVPTKEHKGKPCTVSIRVAQKEHGPKVIFTGFAVTED